MAETAALLADEVFPDVPLRQWVISFLFPLRYVFAAHPKAMGKVLGIIYRAISTHLIHKAGYRLEDGATGAVTLIQRFGWYGIPAPHTSTFTSCSWMMGANIENHSLRVSLLGEPSPPARLSPPRE